MTGDMSSGERCQTCSHDADEHCDVFGWCEFQRADGERCPCLMYVSEEDELEDALASGELPDELDFDHGEDAA